MLEYDRDKVKHITFNKDKVTILDKVPCHNMDLEESKGLGICQWADFCEHLDDILTKTYFDCICGM